MAKRDRTRSGNRRRKFRLTDYPKKLLMMDNIIEADKPCCPKCTIRNYKILEYKKDKDDAGAVIFTVQCLDCQTVFRYRKYLKEIQKISEKSE